MPLHKLQQLSIYWYPSFKNEDLVNSPSRKFMTLSQELQERSNSIKFICKAGKRLRMPQIAIATACNYFHHFYMRNAFANDKLEVCCACSYLASKVEECRKNMRELLKVYYHVRFQKEPPAKDSQESKDFYRSISKYESRLLQAIEFSFQVSHPYQFLMSGIKTLLKDKFNDMKQVQKIAQIA